MKFRIPLSRRENSGSEARLPLVTLRVRDKYGGLAEVSFLVDSAADVSTIPISTAARERTPHRQGRLRTASGIAGSVESYRDEICVIIAGREHRWPCNFAKERLPQPTGQRLSEPLSVLGRAGFSQDY